MREHLLGGAALCQHLLKSEHEHLERNVEGTALETRTLVRARARATLRARARAEARARRRAEGEAEAKGKGEDEAGALGAGAGACACAGGLRVQIQQSMERAARLVPAMNASPNSAAKAGCSQIGGGLA